MKTETVELNGVPISKETILGWAAQCGVKIEPPKPEPYQFKAADVARNNAGRTRIIVRDYGKLVSYDTDGGFQAGSQEDFEECGYKKIGVITDYIK